MRTQTDTVAGLMARFREGNQDAAGRLVEIFYPELRRIAASRMRSERSEHTLQPTALVNELYLQLIRIKALRAGGSTADNERDAFLGLSAYLMRQLLIHHARPLSRRSEKTGLAELTEPMTCDSADLVELDDILNRLGSINPVLRTVVELRVFEGLTREEIACRMKCGTATVARHWAFARNWLEEAFSA